MPEKNTTDEERRKELHDKIDRIIDGRGIVAIADIDDTGFMTVSVSLRSAPSPHVITFLKEMSASLCDRLLRAEGAIASTLGKEEHNQ